MNKLDFADIHLSARERITLMRAKNRVIQKNKCFDRLYRLDLVTDNWIVQTSDSLSFGDAETMIATDYGKDYLSYRAGFFWPEFRNWASLIIAICAFIKSFFF